MAPRLISVTSNRGRTVMKLSKKTLRRPCLFTFRLKAIHQCIVVVLALPTFGAPLLAAPARAPKITLIYTTAETSSSAEVVWNTDTAADSLLQYSTSNPVPVQAQQVYIPTQLTLHEIPLAGLSPGTVYFYKVTSCTKRGCITATGSFQTFPSCVDVFPATGKKPSVRM